MQIGVLSDTHGRLAPAALAALRGVELILHAGDIGDETILAALAAVAPVLAIHGNTDAGTPLARAHPATRWVERGGARIYITHIGGRPAQLLRALPADPAGQPPDVYIFGHSHRPLVERAGGVLFLNPGTAGDPRGHGLSIARLTIADGRADAAISPL